MFVGSLSPFSCESDPGVGSIPNLQESAALKSWLKIYEGFDRGGGAVG